MTPGHRREEQEMKATVNGRERDAEARTACGKLEPFIIMQSGESPPTKVRKDQIAASRGEKESLHIVCSCNMRNRSNCGGTLQGR